MNQYKKLILKEKDHEIYSDPPTRLGIILLKKGIVDNNTLNEAILLKRTEDTNVNGNGNSGRSLAQILVQEFKIDYDLLYKEIANLYAFNTFEINIDEESVDNLDEIKNFIDTFDDRLKGQMLHYKIIPIRFDSKQRDKIILGAVDPTIREIPQIAYSCNAKSYDVEFIPLNNYEKLIEHLFPRENVYLKNLKEDTFDYQETTEEGTVDEELLEVEINKSALINLFEGSLVEAVRQGASDVHFIPISNKEIHISIRIDGRLMLWHKQENTLPEALIAVVKDRSRGLDRFEREKGQDGFIQRNIDGYIIRFRVSILPIAGSQIRNKFESVVIRVLDDRNVITDLEELGLVGYARDSFEKAISKPQGMVILTGPTGCGKSTTIIAALHNVMDPSLNVLTVEDPIEYIIKGARQIKLSHKMNFDQAIRSILRHDPDVVLVGEIRDKDSADIAIKLANTGHLTFSTLHTNDAPSVISRLYKMGIEPFLLAYAINLIVAQRLIRKLCSCKKDADHLDKRFLSNLKLDPDEWKKYEIFEPQGCKKCEFTGFSGRMAIHETLYFTSEISQLIFDAGDKIDEESIRQAAKKDGMCNLRESGYEKVKKGLTSFAEVISNTTED
ncbi:MAG: GspE/PulE family protein [Ignavibacteriaceae bacterium]